MFVLALFLDGCPSTVRLRPSLDLFVLHAEGVAGEVGKSLMDAGEAAIGCQDLFFDDLMAARATLNRRAEDRARCALVLEERSVRARVQGGSFQARPSRGRSSARSQRSRPCETCGGESDRAGSSFHWAAMRCRRRRAGRSMWRPVDERRLDLPTWGGLTANSFGGNQVESGLRGVTSSARLPGWEGGHIRLAAPTRWHFSKRS